MIALSVTAMNSVWRKNQLTQISRSTTLMHTTANTFVYASPSAKHYAQQICMQI